MAEQNTHKDEDVPGAAAAAGDTATEATAAAGSQAPGEGAGDGTFTVVEQELEELRRELEGARESMLRLQADMENLRRRSAREVENAHKYGVERLIAELLPVKDSLELGLAAAQGEGAAAGPAVEALREGVELTLKMLGAALEKFGVEEVAPEQGEPFNPELHQAMSTQEVEGMESGRVVQRVQKGYRLNDRLLRPALVIVSA